MFYFEFMVRSTLTLFDHGLLDQLHSCEYVAVMTWLRRFSLTLCWSLTLLAIAPAFAGNTARPSAKNALPGVEGDYRIVRPVEAEPEQADTNASHFKIGDVDVHVSGSVTIDIGVGSIPAPKH